MSKSAVKKTRTDSNSKPVKKLQSKGKSVEKVSSDEPNPGSPGIQRSRSERIPNLSQQPSVGLAASGSKTVKKPHISNKKSHINIKKDKKNILNISFKDINDEYCWGNYGDTKVILMKENGYVNATKLCSDAKTKTGTKKEFKEWKKNASSKELMKALQNDLLSSGENLPGEKSPPEILIPITTGSKHHTEIRGTYAHPDLIPQILSWASPSFAIRVSRIVNEYFTKIELKKLEEELEIKDHTIHKLNSKVDTLIAKNDQLLAKNSKMDKRLKRLLDLNEDMYDQNEEITNKIDVISNERVVSTEDPEYDHIFVLIKNNDDPNDYDEDKIIYDYYVLRVMRKCYKQRLMEHKARHPDMKVILKITYSPNSVNLWLRVKKKLGKGKGKDRKISYNGCKFNLKNKYSEKKLIRDITKIHNERLDHDLVEV